jgi:hypothetical protein
VKNGLATTTTTTSTLPLCDSAQVNQPCGNCGAGRCLPRCGKGCVLECVDMASPLTQTCAVREDCPGGLAGGLYCVTEPPSDCQTGACGTAVTLCQPLCP